MKEYNIELDYDGSYTIVDYNEIIFNNYIYPVDWPEQCGVNRNALMIKKIKIVGNKIHFKLSEISGFGYTEEFKRRFTLNLIINKGKLTGVNTKQNIPSIRVNKFFKIVNPRLLLNILSLK